VPNTIQAHQLSGIDGRTRWIGFASTELNALKVLQINLVFASDIKATVTETNEAGQSGELDVANESCGPVKDIERGLSASRRRALHPQQAINGELRRTTEKRWKNARPIGRFGNWGAASRPSLGT